MQTTLNGLVKPNIFLTLQKDYGEKRESRYTRTFAIQKCGGEPGEIALRFAGCCLRCGPCFASGYAWLERFQNNRRVITVRSPKDIISDFIRIRYPPNHPNYNW